MSVYLLLLKGDSESDGDKVWNGSDHEGLSFDMDNSEVAPSLTRTALAENSSQHALVVWLVTFLLQLQAKHYIPDKAIDCLLKFLAVFFGVLGRFCGFAAVLATSFPSTLYKLRKSKMIPGTNGFTQCAFICCACDLPAGRKVWLSGTLPHLAVLSV